MTSLDAELQFAHGPTWRNRLTLAPLTNKQSPAGILSADEHRWLVARALGGFGMVMTAAAYVSPAGQAWEGQLGVHDDEMLPGLSSLATQLREAGAVSSVQLHHGGLRAEHAAGSGQQMLAPWDDPAKGARAMRTDEVNQAVADFVAAALRAQRAGFDGVQVHGAHGYLVAQFLDGRHNHRTDGYGGSLEDRSRMLREILTGIREACGADFQVGLRLTPERLGVTLTEAREVAQWVLTSGLVDHLDMSLWDVRKQPHETDHAGRLLIDHFTDLDRGDCRLTVAGKILGAADAQWCLDHGADGVVIGTGAIMHADFAARALADTQFVTVDQPVSRAHLAAESVGPRFVDYLSENWNDFVTE